MIPLILLLLVIAIPCKATPGESLDRIRAAQVFYTPSTTYEGFEEEVKRAKLQGINTIIFRVFGNPGDRIYGIARPESKVGVYFSTSHAPVIDDILGKVIQIAHSHGIQVFAWMTTRDAIYGASDDMLDREFSVSEDREIKIDKLDLFDPKSVRHLENLYSDLAEYKIDGVLFQDDFIVRHMEALGTSARLNFFLNFERMLDPKDMYSEVILKPNGEIERIEYTDEFWDWARWKNERLLEVAKRLTQALKAKNPKIKTLLNATYELFRKPQNSLAWQSHNVELTKAFDYVAVMAYHRQMMDEREIDKTEARMLVKEITEKTISDVGNPKKVIMKVQTINWDNRAPIPSTEIVDIYQTINSASREVGIAFAPWEGNLDINLRTK